MCEGACATLNQMPRRSVDSRERFRVQATLSPRTMAYLEAISEAHLSPPRSRLLAQLIERGIEEIISHDVVSRMTYEEVARRYDLSRRTVVLLDSQRDSLPLITNLTPPKRVRSARPRRNPSPSESFESAFISYGGPDHDFAARLNAALKRRGVKTFFFPVSAKPGVHLHRTMNDAVHEYNRVILVCSKSSLDRPGVLNEIEQVLSREAREGGLPLLLPVTLDDYVFEEWNPMRPDIARQVRSRVALRFDPTVLSGRRFQESVRRLLDALRVENHSGERPNSR